MVTVKAYPNNSAMLDLEYGTGFNYRFKYMHPSKQKAVQMRSGTYYPGF